MARLSLTVLLLALVVGLQTSAIWQESPVAKPAAPAKDAGAMLVRFHDGSIMRLSFAGGPLDVTTKHGKLKIAVSDIRKIEMSTRIPDKAQAEIAQAVRQLGDPSRWSPHSSASSNFVWPTPRASRLSATAPSPT